MPTYFIHQVTRAPDGGPIVRVCVFLAEPDADLEEQQQRFYGGQWKLGPSQPFAREFVAHALRTGAGDFRTYFWSTNECAWKIGDKVVHTDDGFITTAGNRESRDNLGNLPPCTC